MMDPDGITRGAVQTESGTNSNLRHARREEQFRTDPGSEFQFKDKQRIFFFYRSVGAGKQTSRYRLVYFAHDGYMFISE
jgi:hypothetical protein